MRRSDLERGQHRGLDARGVVGAPREKPEEVACPASSGGKDRWSRLIPIPTIACSTRPSVPQTASGRMPQILLPSTSTSFGQRMRPITPAADASASVTASAATRESCESVPGGDGGSEEHGQQEALAGRVPPRAAPPPAPSRLMARRDHGALGRARTGESSEHGLRGIAPRPNRWIDDPITSIRSRLPER